MIGHGTVFEGYLIDARVPTVLVTKPGWPAQTNGGKQVLFVPTATESKVPILEKYNPLKAPPHPAPGYAPPPAVAPPVYVPPTPTPPPAPVYTPPPPARPEWSEYSASDGRKYWHNNRTNSTTWTNPFA